MEINSNHSELTPAEKGRITRRENAEKRAQWRAEHDRQESEDKARLADLMRGIVDDTGEDRKTRLFAAVVLNGIMGRPYFSSAVESLLRTEPDIQAFRNAVEELKAGRDN